MRKRMMRKMMRKSIITIPTLGDLHTKYRKSPLQAICGAARPDNSDCESVCVAHAKIRPMEIHIFGPMGILPLVNLKECFSLLCFDQPINQ